MKSLLLSSPSPTGTNMKMGELRHSTASKNGLKFLICSLLLIFNGAAAFFVPTSVGPSRTRVSGLKYSLPSFPTVSLSRLQSSRGNIDIVAGGDDSSRNENKKASSSSSSSSFDLHRRSLLAAPLALFVQQMAPQPASARGLVQFPCTKGLGNSYHFLRVGTSMLEEEGIWSTNPLFLTNREDALSPAGTEQVTMACQQLALQGRAPTLVKHSLAASSIDTANIVGRELGLGRDRIVPEFTFLDPRGIGGWDMMSKADFESTVWALDNDEAGRDGEGGRPPKNDDGTPNETLADQGVRLRQILSILESQYSGDTILLIFPDGTGPALLSAMIAGIPLNRVHELEFAPGEVRFDITLESTKKLLDAKEKGGAFAVYEKKIEEGRKKLADLRAADPEDNASGLINMKDERLERERLAMEEVMAEKERQRLLAEERAEDIRAQRQQQLAAKNNAEDGDSAAVSPTLFGIAGAIATAGISVVAGRPDKSEKEEAAKSKLDSSKMNVTGTETTLFENPLQNSTKQTGPILDLNSNVGSSLYSSVPQIDPKELAEKAMQEYMDQDDGGEDWLQVMNQIIHEPDDDDEFVTSRTTKEIDGDIVPWVTSDEESDIVPWDTTSKAKQDKEDDVVPWATSDEDGDIVPWATTGKSKSSNTTLAQ